MRPDLYFFGEFEPTVQTTSVNHSLFITSVISVKIHTAPTVLVAVPVTEYNKIVATVIGTVGNNLPTSRKGKTQYSLRLRLMIG